jgi:hypothetical protein
VLVCDDRALRDSRGQQDEDRKEVMEQMDKVKAQIKVCGPAITLGR